MFKLSTSDSEDHCILHVGLMVLNCDSLNRRVYLYAVISGESCAIYDKTCVPLCHMSIQQAGKNTCDTQVF